MPQRRLLGVVAALAGLLTAAGAAAAPAGAAPGQATGSGSGFVTRAGANLKLDGKPFRFAGTNNYYLMYKSPLMVDDVFADARAAGFTVLRTWGFLDIGNQDGSNSVARQGQDGIYFQYWDGDAPGVQRRRRRPAEARLRAGGRPAARHQADHPADQQLERLRRHGPVRALGRRPVPRRLLHQPDHPGLVQGLDQPRAQPGQHAHRRGVQGRPDRDDLGAGQRAALPVGSGVYPRSPNCTAATLTAWADEMSRHIKSVDRRHLVGVGDEGFFCDDPALDGLDRNCGEGVDTVAFSRAAGDRRDVVPPLPGPLGQGRCLGARLDQAAHPRGQPDRQAGDAGRVRLARQGHPQHRLPGSGPTCSTRPAATAASTGSSPASRTTARSTRTTTASPSTARARSARRCPTRAIELHRAAALPYPPVADHDAAVVEFGQAGHAAAGRQRRRVPDVRCEPATIDLDPAAAGRQSHRHGARRACSRSPRRGAVTFTPAEGFAGRATATYTIRDAARPAVQRGRPRGHRASPTRPAR